MPTLPSRLAAVASLAALAACAWRGPGLAGYPGLQWDVVSFYGGRAMEANARCPNPRITAITHTDVVEENAQHVVMDLRYGWVDDTQTVDSGASGGSKIVCRGWGERRFTFDRRSDGGLEVVSMTGPQQR